jgi:Ca2+-binding RTX toxin-like protein
MLTTDPAKQILRQQPLDSLHSLTVVGADNKADKISVDFSIGGDFTIPGGLTVNSGKGSTTTTQDSLTVVGTSQADTFAVASGTVTANGLSVSLVGNLRVMLSGGAGGNTYKVSALSAPVTLVAGSGADEVDFSGSATGVSVDLSKSASQAQRVFGAKQNTLALSGLFTNVVGTPQADTITGNKLNNTIWGLAGNDTIHGGVGDDTLWGGDGNDTLYGDAGNDTLYGEAGNNVLLGGAGNDVLDVLANVSAGAPGRNLLIGDAGQDTLTGGPGEDILVGGSVKNDTNVKVLANIMSQWTSTKSFTDRCDALAKSLLKRGSTVLDDKVTDELFSGTGNDWFLDFSTDNVHNRKATDR